LMPFAREKFLYFHAWPYHFDAQSYQYPGDYHCMVPGSTNFVPPDEAIKTKAKVISSGSPTDNENSQRHHPRKTLDLIFCGLLEKMQ
jgi:hypothetical protein